MRYGIAMIELIFSIVIMGIVLMSAPMLIHTSINSGYISLQQEAISVLASQVNLVLVKSWDANTVGEPIILGTQGDKSLSSRQGRMSRTLTLSTGGTLNAGSIGYEQNDTFNDIDDFDKVTMSLRDFASTDIMDGDILDTKVQILMTVSYIGDSPSSGSYTSSSSMQYNLGSVSPVSTNIKMVSMRLTTKNKEKELNKEIVLSAFSCNIGGYVPQSRNLN
jgi:hypothetical protein